jgi:hypothetical protein
MEINQIIQSTIGLLSENKEWEERFQKYIQNIAINDQKNGKRSFRKPDGLSLYSSVGSKGKSYDLRFRGQSVATVKETAAEKVELRPESVANQKYFEFDLCKEEVDWDSTEASNFRSFFKKESLKFTTERPDADRKYPKSKEHRVENCLLREFSKQLGKEKALCYIQPIKLYNLFFQMPTPLKASTHNPTYSERGGGIDILARIKPLKGISRICVMEVKDENKPAESQATAMSQAVTYAVFIAYLLRSKSGQHWWDFFMGRSLKATKEKDGTTRIHVIKEMPKPLHIDVVTIMPQGTTEEFCDKDIPLEGLDTTLHCHSLYYDGEVFQKDETFIFSGTYPNQLRTWK